MKNLMLQSLRAVLGVLLLLGLAVTVATSSRMAALPERLQVGVLVLAGFAVLCAASFAAMLRRVRSEDRIAGLEAALCREQNARTQADQALAESDLLLERLTARGRGRGAGSDPATQLAAIQAELLQLRQLSAFDDPMLASRVDLLCTRVACVARAVNAGHTVESG